MSILHVVYLTCIRPYVKPDSVVLEIGPGRGAWTKTFLHAKEVWCLDALSAEHNGFWDYVGRAPTVHYHQVSDFTCRMLPDDTFTYLFSFGALCHVSPDGINEYMKNLRPKLKSGGRCFFMVADYHKYNAAVTENGDRLSILNHVERTFAPNKRGLGRLWRTMMRSLPVRTPRVFADINQDGAPSPGRFYHAGVDATCRMLEGLGYEVVDPDVGAVLRDPIIHCVKP